jgi:hypothetical protein
VEAIHAPRVSRGVAAAFGLAAASMLACAATAAPPSRQTITINEGGAALTVEYEPCRLPVTKDALVRWVTRAARSVTAYFGRFPVERARVLILCRGSGRVGGGFTAYGDPFSRVVLGSATTDADLENDWVMTHELVHLAHPSLGKPWAWMEEGVATYVEPIARIRSGALPEDEFWRWLIEGLPKGLPAAGDAGLDNTHTWGRTYWGGALYCFLADLEIRRATANRGSLEDALRGVLAAGGDVRATWSLGEMLAAGDRATGARVLETLHARMGGAPVSVDLGALFGELGVALRGGRVVYDDGAPLASTRRAMTRSRATLAAAGVGGR